MFQIVPKRITLKRRFKVFLGFFTYVLFCYRRRPRLLKHRHQRCKAPRLCKTFFITNICLLKEAGQNKFLSYTDLLTTCFSQRFSHSILQRFCHNVFLTTSFSQRFSHNVFLTTSFSQLCDVSEP